MGEASLHLRAFLAALGHEGDPEMADTPRRFAELLSDFVPRPVDPPTVCATTSATPVVVTGIPFHSLCAHHLLPFSGTAAVAYVPTDRLLGLGSIPRLVAALARRPQLQERLAEQLADAMMEHAAPRSVAVALRARHLCVEMRGAERPAEVLTLAERGAPDPWLRDQVTSR